MSRAHANIALMSAQALARSDSELSERVTSLEDVISSLRGHPALGEAIAEAQAIADKRAATARAEAEAQRKAAEDAAKATQIAALKAQLAALGEEYSPEAVAKSLSPQGDGS